MRNRNAIVAPATQEVSSRLQIVYRDIAELIPQPTNVRRHPKKQIAQIARSIGAFGSNVPFQIDRNSHLIAGHGRLEACQNKVVRLWQRLTGLPARHLNQNLSFDQIGEVRNVKG